LLKQLRSGTKLWSTKQLLVLFTRVLDLHNDFEDLSGNDADKPNFKDFAETYSQYEQYKRCFQNCISSPRNTPDRCQRRCWRSVSLIQRGDEEMEGVKKETDDAVEVEAPTDPFEESDEDLEDEAMFEDEVVEEDTQEE
jgi:hypothetical protein